MHACVSFVYHCSTFMLVIRLSMTQKQMGLDNSFGKKMTDWTTNWYNQIYVILSRNILHYLIHNDCKSVPLNGFIGWQLPKYRKIKNRMVASKYKKNDIGIQYLTHLIKMID